MFFRLSREIESVSRVAYYYSAERPIYLLEIFGKNEKASLRTAERNALAKVVAEIKQQLRGTKT
jgi:hypothetical protein